MSCQRRVWAWRRSRFFARCSATATALANLLAILADPAATATTFAPDALEVKIDPPVAHLLLQKSGRVFALVLWNEQPLSAGAIDPEVEVTLTFGQARATQIFDPIAGPRAIAVPANGRSAVVPVPAHPIVVAIS